MTKNIKTIAIVSAGLVTGILAGVGVIKTIKTKK